MRLGNMTQAAEFLQISQPAVSRMMAELQKTTNLTLFRRTRYGMAPTADAERLLAEVQSVFLSLEELSRRAHAISDVRIGELNVATISLYGNSLLPRIIADFVKLHPEIQVTMEIDVHQRIVDRVHSRRAEIGFVTLPLAEPDLNVVRLATQPAVCALPADHPLASRDLIQPADLADCDFISFPRETSTRFQVDSLFDRLGIARNLRIEAGSHEAVLTFVAAGLGVSIVSPFQLHRSNYPDLTFRPFHPPLMREIGMLSQDEALLSSTALAFRDYVMARFATYPLDLTDGTGSLVEKAAAPGVARDA